MEREIRSKSPANLLPLIALSLSLLAVLLLVCSGFGARFGLWQFRTGFAMLKWSAFLGIASAAIALAAGAVCLKRKRVAGAVISLAAFSLGLACFSVPYSWKMKAQSYPRIHDISTDLDHPPQFVAVVPLRHGPVEYGGAAVAVLQQKAYPDIKTLILGVPAQQAFQSTLEAARELGWEIVAQVPAEGRIEATDTTFWYGFKDDVVIRIVPAGERSLVDIRSVSRVGISDVGTNAKRIRSFLAKLSHQPAPK